ncbi:MAG: tetratricopeptide repeat protein [Burkholderiales bacterium]|nr:tetratricopeptide repeat protein [Burkholderiales bacterium]
MALLCLLAPHAFAEDAEDKLSPVNRDLYLEAMQAISEGRKHDASRLLLQMTASEPKHAGAWLDLALIQCELGNVEETERLFTEIERRFAPPPEIMQIIQARRAIGCHKRTPQMLWNVMLTRGFEQNVNQGTTHSLSPFGEATYITSDSLPKADHYLLLSGDLVRDANQNGGMLFAQFQARRNDYLGQYDSASIFFGAEQPLRLGRWTLRGSATAGLQSLGGQLYQKFTQLQVKVAPPLNLPEGLELQLSSSISHLQYLTLSNFDSNTTEIRGQLQYKKNNAYGSASLALLNDHAIDDRPGGNRHGWLANLVGRAHLYRNVIGEVGFIHQSWRGQNLFLPNFIDEIRQQRFQSLRAALVYPWADGQSLQLEMRQVRNRENIPIFQYNNRQIQLSWQWQSR